MQRKHLVIYIVILLLFSLSESGRSETSNEETIRILIGKYKKDFSASGTNIRLSSMSEGKNNFI